MAITDPTTDAAEDMGKLREEWLERLSGLVETLRGWARDADWSTRQISKSMEDSRIGSYKAPALVLQKETARVLLEPVARSAPGVEGVVDLYLMPAFDDVATLYFHDGGWRLHHLPPGATAREAEPRPLTEETFRSVLDDLVRDAE